MTPAEYLNKFGNLPFSQRPAMRNGDDAKPIICANCEQPGGDHWHPNHPGDGWDCERKKARGA